MTAATGPEGEGPTGFRPDIEGLRAVAVILIVLYHAGVRELSGGFVGVDVFFAISGFLITGLLARELDVDGRLNLLEFYARRVRRILPAAFVVLGVTLVLSAVLLSPVGFARITPDLAAAMAYVPNVLFAFRRTDYFHPAHISPVIHYWSLGVEEQFYLLWPAGLWFAYRLVSARRARLLAIVGGLVVLSFGLALVGTAIAPAAAFYLLPTRAWELGVGAVLALARPRLPDRFAPAGPFLGLAGLVLIGIASVVYRESTPFPGIAAVLPVAGAGLVIAAGGGTRTWSQSMLGWGPLRYVGRVSYSVYLWHWPLLVFVPVALPAAPSLVQAGLAVVLTFVLADATFRWVEDPMRRGWLIGRMPSRNLFAAAAVSAALIAATLGTSRILLEPFRHAGAPASVPAGVDPFAGVLPLTGPVADGPLPADLDPPVLHLHRGRLMGLGGCSLLSGKTVNGSCTFGSAAAATKVVLFGDSHLTQWWPAIKRIMVEHDWRVVYLVKTSCTYADVTTAGQSGAKAECDAWRNAAFARIQEERPAYVILSANHRAPPIVDGRSLAGVEADAAMQAGAERTIARLEALGARVAVLADTPELPYDPAECLTANPEHVARCSVARDQALGLDWHVAERAAAGHAGAAFIDVDEWACPADPCPLVVGHFAVYADANHLTRAFVEALTVRLNAALVASLGLAGGSSPPS